MATAQFDSIFHGLSPELGKIRFAQTGLAWKALQGDETATISAANIKWAQWLRVARNFQLRVGLKDNRRRETFDGFQREDHDKLAGIFKQYYDVALETKDTSHKGWNWGTTDFQGEDLAFLVSNKTAFEVPMKFVANSNIAGKTEVSLEFAPMNEKDKKAKGGRGLDELVEMRFYVPGVVERAASDNEDGEKKNSEDEEEEQSAAQVFHDAVRDRAEIGQGIMGESIVLFEDVLVITPRGRYDIDMFTDFMRLRGKTYDYKILYSQISRLFLLPKADDIHVQFIIGLEPPIRQGQTKYPYLVTMFSRDQELEIDLNLEEEVLNTKYEGKLDRHYETAMYQVVSTVFRGLTGKKITGTSSFQSVSGHPSIKCNQKTAQGELFILEKTLFFVTKQPTLIQFEDIHQVVFSRLGSARTIDVKIIQQSGPEIVFSGVNKEEHEGLEEFIKGKKARTKNEMSDDVVVADLGEDDDDDEEMQSVASDDDEPARPRAANDDDEDSEEDEDFEASSSDEGSPSDSSDEDSNAASDASDDMVKEAAKAKAKAKTKAKAKAKEGSPGSPPKKKKKKVSEGGAGAGDSEKKKKKANGSGKTADDAMDVDSPAPKPKPKPKPKPGEEDEPAKKKQKRD